MSEYTRLRRQQLIREAEGYVEFMALGAERWSLSQANLDLLGARALAVLAKLDPKSGQRGHALYLTGMVYRAMGRHAEAIDPLIEANKLDQGNLEVGLALGWCYKRIQRVDLAIEALTEVLQANDQEAIVHYNLACYWSLSGNVGAAVRCLAHAFELNPEYRDKVTSESDFDPIRNHPEFQSVISSVIV